MAAEGGLGVLDADDLIDEIIAKKGVHKYTGGLSEENWEEEIEQIPLFMTKSPDTIDPAKSPGLAALQQMKYENDTPEGKALSFKEDGNSYFKDKHYIDAIDVYTEGIKQNCADADINAVLYCNRSAAHYHLGNMRSSVADATQSRRIKPTHLKAYIRGAEANFKLKKYQETQEWCDGGLTIEPTCTKLRDLRAKAVQEKKKQDRDLRKQAIVGKETTKGEEKLLDAIKSRKIRLASSPDDVKRSQKHSNEKLLSLLEPDVPANRVSLNEDGRLMWPVLFLYPEHGQSELIEAFHEDSRFSDQIDAMFGSEVAPWDTEGKYRPDTIELWYEDFVTGEFISVSPILTLGEVINDSNKYTVVSGVASFLILAKGSRFRDQYIKSQD